MSALLDGSFETNSKIDLQYDPGEFPRTFSRKRPIVTQSKDYVSSFFLIYRKRRDSKGKIINFPRLAPRNFFTMYLNDKSRKVYICRTNTTITHADADVILLHDCIQFETLLPEQNCYSSWDLVSWLISYDYDINYSNKKPEDLDDFKVFAWGEWWLFDRGICLNGLSRCTRNENKVTATFIYFELLPRYLLPKNVDGTNRWPRLQQHAQSTSPPHASSAAATTRARINAADIKIYLQVQHTQAQRYYSASTPKQSVVPSIKWFVDRAQQLEAGNLSYFTCSPRACVPA